MSSFTMNRRINAPRDVVFDVFADLEHAPDRVSGIRKVELLTDGPIGVGTRWRETREVFKKEATEEMAITDFKPGEGYTVECDSCGAHYKTEFRFEPDGRATNVVMDFETRAVSAYAKIMSPVGKLLMGPIMKKCMSQDLDDLAAACEEGTPAPV